MRLDLATRTLFSDFQETCFARVALEREVAALPRYVSKTVKGKRYWYEQRYQEARAKQHYLGPADKKQDALVETAREEYRSKRALFKRLHAQELRQAAMLTRGGVPKLDSRMAQVVRALSDGFLIDQGGLLVGSLAFQAYSGMLGALFEKATLKTHDVDIVFDRHVELIPPHPIHLEQYLHDCGLAFRGVPQLKPRDPASSYIGPDGIRIDLLTPQRGRPKGIRRNSHLLESGVMELPFLDFLISESIRSVLIGPKGGIPVQVPHPSRFAIHKLIVANRRSVSEGAKREKDLHQASQLLHILMDEDPTHLKTTWKEARARGKKWQRTIQESLSQLDAELQQLLRRSIA